MAEESLEAFDEAEEVKPKDEKKPHWTVDDQIYALLDHLRHVYGNPDATPKEKNAPFEIEANIEVLAQLRRDDQLAYDQTVEEIWKITKLAKESLKNGLKGKVDKYASEHAPIKPREEKQPEEPSEYDKKVNAKAEELANTGKIYDYIYNVWQKKVKGNALLGKCLIISRGVQSCTNSKGLHVYAHGRWGQGKSHGMEVAAELLPDALILDSDVSPKVLYYMQNDGKLLSATTFLMDDVEINNPLAGLYKKITTKFQKGARHTVVIDGEVLKLQLPPRCNIWTNSVEFQGDEQVRDRFLDVPIEEDQTKEIIEYMKQVDQEPLDEEEREFEVEVCRTIFAHIGTGPIHVEIPFSKRIDFPVSENTRGYAIFSDLIRGLAILHFRTREQDDKGHLLANEDDFKEAKLIYEGLSGHGEQKYGTVERKVLKAIIASGRKATLDQLHKATGLSESRLKDIFNGRSNNEQRKASGLLAKCAALRVLRETTTENLQDGKTKTSTHNIYILDDEFNLVDEGCEMIKIDNISEVDVA